MGNTPLINILACYIGYGSKFRTFSNQAYARLSPDCLAALLRADLWELRLYPLNNLPISIESLHFDEFNEPIPLSFQMVLNELTELETAVSYPGVAEDKVQALAQCRKVLAKRLRSGM
jgi:hypothetical protein